MVVFQNIEVFVPILVLVVLVQSRKSVSLPLSLLQGIKLFQVKYFYGSRGSPPPAKEENTNSNKKEGDEDEIPVEQLMTQSDLTMTEISTENAESILFIKSLYYHAFLEILLYLNILVFLTHIVSSMRQAIYPAIPGLSPFDWTVLCIACSIFFCLQSQLLLLIGNGWNEFEVKLAVGVGALTFVLLSLLSLLGINTLTSGTFFHFSLHMKALMVQIAPDFPYLSQDTFDLMLRLSFTFLLGLFATLWTVPAMRFTLTLNKMSMGQKFEKVSQGWIFLCAFDFVIPFLITILFSPGLNRLVQQQINAVHANCDTAGFEDISETCAFREAVTSPTVSTLFCIQLMSLLLVLITKALTFLKHMQSFMDYSVKSSVLVMMVSDASLKKNLLKIITYRSRYLVALAFEFLSVPLLFFNLMLLLVRSIPQGLGLGRWIQTTTTGSLDSYNIATTAWLNHNTTALAIDQARNPSLIDATFRLLGVLVKSEGMSEAEYQALKKLKIPRSSDCMLEFFRKFVQIYYLPPKISLTFFQEMIFNVFLVWSVLTILSFLLWIIFPDPLKEKLSSPK